MHGRATTGAIYASDKSAYIPSVSGRKDAGGVPQKAKLLRNEAEAESCRTRPAARQGTPKLIIIKIYPAWYTRGLFAAFRFSTRKKIVRENGRRRKQIPLGFERGA